MRAPTAGFAVSVLLLAGCSFGDGDDHEADKPATELEIQAATCNAVELVVYGHRMMADRNEEGAAITFSSLVADRKATTINDGVAAGLGLMMKDVDYGPYGPAMRYLVRRSFAWDPEFASEYTVPARTDAVVRSAARLDRDLAKGMCGAAP